MTPHIHAASALLYAQDMAETDRPWERWEIRPAGHDAWYPAQEGHVPLWHINCQYRRKPTTIKVPAVELPEPLRVEPKEGQEYFLLDIATVGFSVFELKWEGNNLDRRAFDTCRIFSTREACQAWADHFNAALKGAK